MTGAIMMAPAMALYAVTQLNPPLPSGSRFVT